LARTQTLGCLIGIVLLASCASERRLVVGSKNFTEQLVLGEIVAQHVENRLGIRVERKLNLGGTLLAHGALAAGQIDLYPEYTGTALTAVLKLPPEGNAAGVLATVRKEYTERFNVRWLDPLGFENTFAIVVRGEDARRNGLDTISAIVPFAPQWRLGAGYEFQQRPDGLSAIEKTYGLRWRTAPAAMDLGLLYRALEQKDVDAVAANSTDAQIATLDVRVLTDDRQVFPPYEAAVAVREQALADIPGLEDALRELSGRLTVDTMRELNAIASSRGQDEGSAARHFLSKFTAAARPERIVSTTPSITEMLFRLGAGDRVAAVTTYCRYPAEAREKPKIGTFLQPNLEAITALQPGLVVIQQNPVELRSKLERLGLKVLELEMWNSTDVLNALDRLGAAIGAADEAAHLRREIEAELETIRARTARLPKRKLMFVVGRSPGTLEGLIAVGNASYLGELIELAGGVNIFADSVAAYPKISTEEIIARDPDVIVDMGEMGPAESLTPPMKADTLRAWSKLPVLRAVRERRVYPVAADIFVVPGPRMVVAAREFARMLHPEAGW
jgi:osmoprotectant transport system substrate-binding protein